MKSARKDLRRSIFSQSGHSYAPDDPEEVDTIEESKGSIVQDPSCTGGQSNKIKRKVIKMREQRWFNDQDYKN